MKENSQEEQIDSFDNFWDDEPRDRRPSPAPRRLNQFVIGGITAVLAVLLMLFMFSDRDPPERPKSQAQSELIVPLDAPESADSTTETGQQPVPALTAASDDMASVPAMTHEEAPMTAGSALPSQSGSRSTMDVRRDAPPLPVQPQVAPVSPQQPVAEQARSRPAPVPYQPGMAPRPADGPEAAARQITPPHQVAGQQGVPTLSSGNDPLKPTVQENSREAGLQARLAQENGQQAAGPASTTDSSKDARRFLVQLGAFKTRENADKLVQSLDTGGQLRLRVVEDPARGVFKVQSGPYPQAAEAHQAREQIMRKANHLQPIILPLP